MKKTASESAATVPQEEHRVLLVEDDVGLQKQMRWALSPYIVDVAGSRVEALDKIAASKPYHVVVLDLGLPPDENSASEGLKALDEILNLTPQTKVIVASGNVERANAVRAVAKGAFDFVAKPLDSEVLKIIIDRAIRMNELEEENRQLREHSAPRHRRAGIWLGKNGPDRANSRSRRADGCQCHVDRRDRHGQRGSGACVASAFAPQCPALHRDQLRLHSGESAGKRTLRS